MLQQVTWGQRELWLDKTGSRRKGEEHLAEENRQHETIDSVIHEGRGVSFCAVDSVPHSCEQPVRAGMDG